jgi:hypothetical protein
MKRHNFRSFKLKFTLGDPYASLTHPSPSPHPVQLLSANFPHQAPILVRLHAHYRAVRPHFISLALPLVTTRAVSGKPFAQTTRNNAHSIASFQRPYVPSCCYSPVPSPRQGKRERERERDAGHKFISYFNDTQTRVSIIGGTRSARRCPAYYGVTNGPTAGAK